MTPHDLAKLFLTKARDDLDAALDLATNPLIADEVVGFHAQQCVEKSLKAVLQSAGIPFEKTHNIDVFLQLMDEAGLDKPDWLEETSALTPFAVMLRYTELKTT